MTSNEHKPEEAETLLTFPCEFPFKVMGMNTASFEADFMVILRKHIPKLGDVALDKRPSRKGNYVALNITFTANSREQLDALYREVTAHPETRMVL